MGKREMCAWMCVCVEESIKMKINRSTMLFLRSLGGFSIGISSNNTNGKKCPTAKTIEQYMKVPDHGYHPLFTNLITNVQNQNEKWPRIGTVLNTKTNTMRDEQSIN